MNSVAYQGEIRAESRAIPPETGRGKEHVMRAIVYLVTVIALAAVTATASAGSSRSSCQANRTFQQASQNGSLPAIYAAVHGAAAPNASSLDCLANR